MEVVFLFELAHWLAALSRYRLDTVVEDTQSDELFQNWMHLIAKLQSKPDPNPLPIFGITMPIEIPKLDISIPPTNPHKRQKSLSRIGQLFLSAVHETLSVTPFAASAALLLKRPVLRDGAEDRLSLRRHLRHLNAEPFRAVRRIHDRLKLHQCELHARRVDGNI